MIENIAMIKNYEYRGFRLKVFYSNMLDIAWDQYKCVAHRDGILEQVRDPSGILHVIRHNPEEISFTVSSKDIVGNPIYDNNIALAIFDVFQYKVDEYLNKQNKSIAQLFNSVKTYHCTCCGTTYTTDQLGYTPACKNCGALMKESV